MTVGDSPVSLAHLVRRSAAVSYQDLAKLLEDIPAKDDAARKTLILDFCSRVRHRLARLLSLAHWSPQLGHIAVRAAKADFLADERDCAYEDAADALWHLSHQLDNNPIVVGARAPLVVEDAVRALRGSPLCVLPTKIEEEAHRHSANAHEKQASEKIGKHQEANDNDHLTTAGNHLDQVSSAHKTNRSSRVQRITSTRLDPSGSLGGATRALLRLCAPRLDHLRILRWHAGPFDSMVAVGVPRTWEALLVLTSPDVETALFSTQSVRLLLPNNDAFSIEKDNEGYESSLSADRANLLASLANDRMATAVKSTTESDEGKTSRAIVMLDALYSLLTFEFCAPLIIERFRHEATVLKANAWKNTAFDIVPCPSPKAPTGALLVLTYWNDCRDASRLVFTPARRRQSRKRPRDGAVAYQQHFKLITVTHDPPLPIVHRDGLHQDNFDDDNISLENILLSSLNARAMARLEVLSSSILKYHDKLDVTPERVRLKYANRRSAGPSLTVFSRSSPSSGIEIRVSLSNGALKGRPFGAASLTCASANLREHVLLRGQCQCPTIGEEEASVISILNTVLREIMFDTASRSASSLDLGISRGLPPGSLWTIGGVPSDDPDARHEVPPFVPLARKDANRFLAMSFLPPRARDRHNMNGMYSSRYAGVSPEWRQYMLPSSRRQVLDYAFTVDNLVFIQDSDFLNDPNKRGKHDARRYEGTAHAAASWGVIYESVERRMRRDSLLRAFNTARVAHCATSSQLEPKETREDDAMRQLEAATRTLIKVKSEPLPLRDAVLLLRGNDAWQIRCLLLPPVFDDTDSVLKRRRLTKTAPFGGYGTMWTFGMACVGNVLTFTYPSANAAAVRSFFKDLTRARTAAALARGVPRSPFFRVLRRSPVRLTLSLGPFNRNAAYNRARKPLYKLTVEYLYSKGNSGGFSVCFIPPMATMRLLAPLLEEALDSSGGAVGLILAGLLERACPVAAAAESAVRRNGDGRIRFVTALRVRAVFAGMPVSPMYSDGQSGGTMKHAVDLDARAKNGDVTVIDVGRATAVMIAQGFAPRSGNGVNTHSGHKKPDFFPLPKWDEIVGKMCREGNAKPQRSASTVVLRIEALHEFLAVLVASAKNA